MNCDGCYPLEKKKAEDRAVQQWENGRYKKLEEVEETIRNEFEISHKKQKSHSIKQHSVSDSTSPEILCDMLADGEDSDYNMQDMSSTQLAAIIDYKDKAERRKQEEIAQKINETVNKLQLNKRHVYPMLKVQVIDVNSDSNRGFILKLSALVTRTYIYYEKEPQRGELYTTKKTMFKPEPAVPLLYNDFRRRLTTLEEVSQKGHSPMFEEFDTVGLVVEVKAEETTQEAWLVDASGRLLLVYVTKGPRNCLIMDNLKRGYATTACNLVYRGLCHNDTVVLAMAGLSTVFSCYSQYRHLHEGLLAFQQQLPKDLDALLSDCDKKIESYRNSRNMNTRNSQTFLDDSDDYTLVSSKLTRTDVALSLIDVDTLN
ncbi:hypothetical protein NQ317_015943 [Molorchus minor]|uniref:BRCA2 OB3 domain-containing protein n=1 Tax=Molorchus minor TaxID=1323400 RepID=A0ABQ9IUW6_9CUCU|nr:hypothetical protein NQ317_015943 [Molorchus minor]